MTLIMVGVGFTLGIVGPLLAQQDDTIYQPGNGVSAPKLVTDVKPQYSADAVRRGVTGVVLLQCVVDRDGVPTSLEVVRPLDEDLDQVGLRTLRQWRFEPGGKTGDLSWSRSRSRWPSRSGNPGAGDGWAPVENHDQHPPGSRLGCDL